MKLKTLLALLVLAQALVHPLAHALPVLTGAQEQAQSPAQRPGTQFSNTTPCPGCLAHRLLPAVTLLATAFEPEWEPVAPAPRVRIPSVFLLTRSARAPPQA